MDRVECVVVGAGVVGLAIARRLAQAGLEVVVLEAAEGIGTVTSSRNSEVIHAGIYYPAGKPDGADVRRRQARAVRLLPRSRHPASQLRQADRCDNAIRDGKAAIDQGACRSQWRARHGSAERRGRARAGAGAELRRGAAVAFHRHCRQPCLHAGAARRCGSRRRRLCLSRAAAARQGCGRRH